MMKKSYNITFFLALLIVSVILLLGILAPMIAPYNPFQPDMLQRLQAPSRNHWFGTDVLGRDLFSRILFGGRYTISLALLASLLSVAMGTLLGSIAGYYGKWLDNLVILLSNIFQGIPGACFMVAIAGFFGPSLRNLLLALVITSWAGFSRIVRAEVLKVKEEPFIMGLICIGCSKFRILFFHILPNIFSSLLILAVLRMSRGVLAVAGLSFLGLGVQPPTPDWSVMISDSMLYYRSYPYLILVPGSCIFLLVYSINTIGTGLSSALHVRSDEVRKW